MELPHERWARERREERAQAAHLRRLLRLLPEPWALKTPEPIRHMKDRVSRAIVEGCGFRIVLCAPLEEDRYHIDTVRIDGRSISEEERQMVLDLFLTEAQQESVTSSYDEALRVSRHIVPIGALG